MATKASPSSMIAKAYAVSFEIMCPAADGHGCIRSSEPIPAPDGSHIWRGHLPETVTCPDCQLTFRVGRKIHAD